MSKAATIWRMVDRLAAVASVALVILVGWSILTAQPILSGTQGRLRSPFPPVQEVNGTFTSTNETSVLPATAKVVLIEFSDFQCPYCGRYARMTYPLIRVEYVETGRLAYVNRSFPL